eukprot:COSAG05_NODE_2336_length_3214_cov_2.012520_2_plen_362_part_00
MAFIGKLFISPDTFETGAGICALVAAEISACKLKVCEEVNSTIPAAGGCNITSCLDALSHLNGTGSCLEELSENGKLSEGGYGVVQLLFLMAAYGFVLFNGANLIGDWAELLLLVPSLAGIVGTLVLPILGAVPDGAMVLFSGLGPTAQSQLSVGMGALAGSTIMLLTVPWFLSILAGRVDIENGKCKYKVPTGQRKLTPGRGLTQSGVSCERAVPDSCKIMLVTSIGYVIMQAPAMGLMKDQPNNGCTPPCQRVPGEHTISLVGLIVACALFVLVCIYQVVAGGEETDPVLDSKINAAKKDAISAGLMNFTGAFFEQLLEMMPGSSATPRGGLDASLLSSPQPSGVQKARLFLKPYYKKY